MKYIITYCWEETDGYRPYTKEEFEGTWEELQAYIKALKADGCFDFHIYGYNENDYD